MSAGKRPGGLTALAILNFVYGAFLALQSFRYLSWVVLLSLPEDQLPFREGSPNAEVMKRLIDGLEEAGGIPVVLLMAALQGMVCLLLIIAGVGYLRQKRISGRFLGNVYAIIAVVQIVVYLRLMPELITQGFSLATLVGLVYPALTLIVINTTFRRDFLS